jgi:hypothetical protein
LETQRTSDASSTGENGSVARIQGLIGIIAIGLGNITTIITSLDQIGQFISRKLGPELLFRLNEFLLYGAMVLMLVGYGSLTYWLYENFIRNHSKLIKIGFFIAAIFAVGSTLYASYLSLFKKIDVLPMIQAQAISHTQTILNQQVNVDTDDGGFKFSRAGASTDTQAWTTAQCLTALLQQDRGTVTEQAQSIRRAFDYLERSRLAPNGGWGYVKGVNWAVTEIAAWVALAYLYSLEDKNVGLIWKAEELPDARARTHATLNILIDRQYSNGGWSAIEKTSELRYVRTYSTVMAVWALAKAERNKAIASGNETRYRTAVATGANWLLGTYSHNAESNFSGWWPNHSVSPLVGEFPGLTAQVLFVLSETKALHPFIGTDSKFRESIVTFLKFAIEGNNNLERLTKRQIHFVERAHDTNRYLAGRSEAVEQSTFLWYPWTIALLTSLQNDPVLRAYQLEQLKDLTNTLLSRTEEASRFVRNDEAMYPTAELLFAEGYYISKNPPAVTRK